MLINYDSKVIKIAMKEARSEIMKYIIEEYMTEKGYNIKREVECVCWCFCKVKQGNDNRRVKPTNLEIEDYKSSSDSKEKIKDKEG